MRTRVVVRSTVILAACVMATTRAAATTLIHEGLDRLVGANELVLQGRVLDIHSYWNADRSFILTDVHVRASQVIKGRIGNDAGDVTFTVMGGSVGDVTIVLVAGPDLVPGSEYVLFLARDGLPGAPNRLTIRDLAQGVFDVKNGRARSQAAAEPLLPDAAGRTEAPGGEPGVALDDLLGEIRGYVGR